MEQFNNMVLQSSYQNTHTTRNSYNRSIRPSRGTYIEFSKRKAHSTKLPEKQKEKLSSATKIPFQKLVNNTTSVDTPSPYKRSLFSKMGNNEVPCDDPSVYPSTNTNIPPSQFFRLIQLFFQDISNLLHNNLNSNICPVVPQFYSKVMKRLFISYESFSCSKHAPKQGFNILSQ